MRGGDAFAGQTPQRSYKDIMAEQQLAKEKDQVCASQVPVCVCASRAVCWHQYVAWVGYLQHVFLHEVCLQRHYGLTV